MRKWSLTFTPSQGTNAMAQSRTLAILHAAIHDALNAIEPRFLVYSPGLGRANGASAEAAVAAAARDVLLTLLRRAARHSVQRESAEWRVYSVDASAGHRQPVQHAST